MRVCAAIYPVYPLYPREHRARIRSGTPDVWRCNLETAPWNCTETQGVRWRGKERILPD